MQRVYQHGTDPIIIINASHTNTSETLEADMMVACEISEPIGQPYAVIVDASELEIPYRDMMAIVRSAYCFDRCKKSAPTYVLCVGSGQMMETFRTHPVIPQYGNDHIPILASLDHALTLACKLLSLHCV